MPTRILLVDDHTILRGALRALLEAEPDLELVAEAREGREAVQMARDLKPDVVVMDVSMPGLNGIEATRQIRAADPTRRVLALSAHSDKRMVAEAIRAGAGGYMVKDAAFEELVVAIRTVISGKIYLSPGLGDAAKDLGANGNASVFTKLTAREREVLQLMAEGKATKEVASCLHVSVKTVETHRAKLMDKLDLHSVAELTKYALREGLTTLEM